ncbi:MAG TPA: DUF1553 domain-containing protein [Planctomycetaceae bacterium]|nr:DUF1553 domain-containing protein [Planctomycetaceae bacterium]
MRGCSILVAAGLAVLLVSAGASADERWFRERVAPVLEAHCVRCHGGPTPKGGLDLTTREGVLAGGESGPAVVPGRVDESLLPGFLSGDEPLMPKGDEPLSREQIAALERWIGDGAAWPEAVVLRDRSRWWSLVPLERPPVPETAEGDSDAAAPVDAGWPRTPVDAFVRAKQRDQGLSPSPAADRRTLIRRLTFDLHGLPPSPDEIDEFLADASPDAWHKLADRLLASPRYGERWGRHWLDVAHYGDTHGYDKDKRRANAWPYRDYVIRAFNEDKPYGQFVGEQLAGDSDGRTGRNGGGGPREAERGGGPHQTRIEATGFIVAGPWDFVGHVELREGTTDKEITRSLDRDDMVMTTMSTFASLTVHCARCHDHKFDPISQQDYYSLQAVFAGVERADRPFDADPQVAVRRTELLAKAGECEQQLAAIHAEAARVAGPELVRIRTRLKELIEQGMGAKRPEYGYHSAIATTPEAVKWVQVDLGRPVAIERVVLIGCHDEFAGIGAGFGFPVQYKVEISDAADFAADVVVAADRTGRDVPNPGVAPQEIAAGGARARYVRVTATRLAHRQNDYIFALAELKVLGPDGVNLAVGAAVTALDSIEAPVRWRKTNLVDGIYVGSDDEDRRREIARLEVDREALLKQSLPPGVQERRATLDERLAAFKAELSALPPQQLVYAAAPEFTPQGAFTPPPRGKPRPIHVLQRGSVTSPGELAGPGTVSCVSGLPARFALSDPDDEATRRTALAGWIADRRNPLTWRSIANRVWHYHFGRGIVETPNDFGRMGARPTHPELLDWLAVELIERGGSLKHIQRQIVTSAVYRQSSAIASDSQLSTLNSQLAMDAGNQSLWRMNRRRLEAEAVRDAVLAASGQLRQTMYGPGFDLFEFEDDHSPRYVYERHDVDDPAAQRRSVYRFVVRSAPDPFLETLDCPDPSLNAARRNTTITSLQALALLNNRFMVRQAEHFAARVAECSPDLEGQIEAAFLLALGRPPRGDEATRLAGYAREHGLANVCRVLFNTNEFVFVD